MVSYRPQDGVDHRLAIRKPSVRYDGKIVGLIHDIEYNVGISQKHRSYFGPDIDQMRSVQKPISKDTLLVRRYLDTSRIESPPCISVVVVQIDDNQPTGCIGFIHERWKLVNRNRVERTADHV